MKKFWRRIRRRKRKIDLTDMILLVVALGIIRTFMTEIIIIGAAALTVWIVVLLRKSCYLRRVDFHGIDNLDPFQFEEYVGNLFRAKRYRVEVTKRSKDWGADVIARSPKGLKVAIQVKHSKKDRPIGIDAVQQVFASTMRYHCKRAIVVTNSTSFTSGARELARDTRVELWDREQLAEEIASTRQTVKGSPLLQLVSTGIGALNLPQGNVFKEHGPYCPTCGAKLVGRTGKYGPFLSCSGYPKCKYATNH